MLLAVLLDGTQPTDIWHDTLFLTLISIAGTIFIGVFSIVATYLITKKFSSTPIKEVSFEVLSDLPLSFTKKKEKVELKVSGTPVVDDLSFVDIEIRNTGTRAVARNDYDTPIELEFKGRNVLFCEITNQKPQHIINPAGLNTFFTIDPAYPEKVKLATFLLNKGHFLRIQVAVSGTRNEINGWANIVDGNFVRAYPVNKPVVLSRAFVISAFISLVLIVGGLDLLSFILSTKTPLSAPIIVLIVLVIFLALLAISIILVYREQVVRLQNNKVIV